MASLGARLLAARHFEDNTLFDDAQGSRRRAGQMLRLRRTDAAALVTFKGPADVAAGVKARREVEFEVSDPNAFEQVLIALGYRACFRYQKYRESYAHADAEIVIDETPVGTFLEIEGDAAAIHRTAGALGFAKTDYMVESYVDVFFASGGSGDMVFSR